MSLLYSRYVVCVYMFTKYTYKFINIYIYNLLRVCCIPGIQYVYMIYSNIWYIFTEGLYIPGTYTWLKRYEEKHKVYQGGWE